MTWRDLTPTAAQAELRTDASLQVLDVRTPAEFASHRLANATQVPVQDLARRLSELDPEANWLVYCEHGRRSVFACELLARAGFSRLANLRGGIVHWAGEGLPIETGPTKPGR